jgi:hypothetical protein
LLLVTPSKKPSRLPLQQYVGGKTLERSHTITNPWTYGDVEAIGVDMTRGAAIVGFDVEAIDGRIGEVDEAICDDAGAGYLIVDTGPWILGKKIMLPAGVVERVDLDSQTVFVDRTQKEVENAPELDEGLDHDEGYRSHLWAYYDRERNTAAL